MSFPLPPVYWSRRSDVKWPPGSSHPAASTWLHPIMGLQVLRSIATMEDGSQWIHVSVARRSKMPNWEDLSKVKKDFIGDDLEAYQVMAKASDHVNVHQFCLHLWAPLEEKNKLAANLQRIQNEVAV